MDNENKTTTAIAEVSELKLAANRLNAQKSTGPRTVTGKNKSKFNAVKHGLRAKDLVIPALGDGESESAFNEELGQLWEQLAPQGIREEMLVEDIAVYRLRLRRALRCEAGEIRRQVEEAQSIMAKKQEKISLACLKNQFHSTESKLQLKQSSVGIEHLISVLETVKDLVKTNDLGWDFWFRCLSGHVGGDDDYIVEACADLAKKAAEAPSEPEKIPGKPAQRSKRQYAKDIFSLLSDYQLELKSPLKEAEKREQRERHAELASLSLPKSEVMDKILRYETAIERRMYRAISELERLQRMRKGESVLPPIKVDIAGQN